VPITGLRDLTERYRLLLCDVFGVLHHGGPVHPAAGDALARFRAGGGTVVLVSNSSAAGDALGAALVGKGLPRAAFDAAVTSGDVTRALLRARGLARVHHIGAERERDLFDGLGVALTGPDAAEIVVCTGLRDERLDRPESHRPVLERARARGLDLVCSNPDRMVETGAGVLRFAGLVADLYEALGGRVLRTGKPGAGIYQAAFSAAEGAGRCPVDRSRVLAIGDSEPVDMAGAAALGLDGLLIAPDPPAPNPGARGPERYRLPALRW